MIISEYPTYLLGSSANISYIQGPNCEKASASLSLVSSPLCWVAKSEIEDRVEIEGDKQREMGFGFLVGIVGGFLLAHAAFSTVQCTSLYLSLSLQICCYSG